MRSDKKNMSNAKVWQILLNKKSKVKLSNGIGIGSTRDEVIKEFCNELNPDYYNIGTINDDYFQYRQHRTNPTTQTTQNMI
jgi:hypothetical protein